MHARVDEAGERLERARELDVRDTGRRLGAVAALLLALRRELLLRVFDLALEAFLAARDPACDEPAGEALLNGERMQEATTVPDQAPALTRADVFARLGIERAAARWENPVVRLQAVFLLVECGQAANPREGMAGMLVRWLR